MIELNRVYEGDCLKLLAEIPDSSVHLVLTDPPYSVTKCSWDIPIPFKDMWLLVEGVLKVNGVVCLFGREPFSSKLRLSKLKLFKYDWIWHKSNPTGMSQANKRPMTYHEIISVFYSTQPTYNKIMIPRLDGRVAVGQKLNMPFNVSDKQTGNQQSLPYKNISAHRYDKDWKNPSSVLYFNSLRANSKEWNEHPTQKPLALIEYFVKTYTNIGDTVLDFCAGSGTTGVACKNLGRNYILIEKEPKYVEIARERLKED